MHSDDSSSFGPPVNPTSPSFSLSAPGPLVPKSDLTYRVFKDLFVDQVDVHQSLFTGSMISKSRFSGTGFARCDLDGIRIEESTFENCDFTACDVRSSLFLHCNFRSCRFDEAHLGGCEFLDSAIENCSFGSASVVRSRFERSTLRAATLTRGTFLHNRFYESTIADTVLGDCTFLYTILRDCTLEGVTINAESVGTLFGLTRQQLHQARFVYLGDTAPVPPGSDLVDLLVKEYESRRWGVGRFVLALNFRLTSAIGAIRSYLVSSYARFIEIGFVKEEELEFLADVLRELDTRNRAPLLALFDVLEWCTALETRVSGSSSISSQSNVEIIRALVGRVGIIVNRQFELIDDDLLGLDESQRDEELEFIARFEVKPDVDLAALFNSLADRLGRGSSGTRTVASRKGSYVETLATCLFSVYAFQVFLFLLNGCVIQLTELKQRTKILTKSKAPKSYVEVALSPRQPASPALLHVIPSLLKFAKGLPWLDDLGMAGLSADNIQALERTGTKGRSRSR